MKLKFHKYKSNTNNTTVWTQSELTATGYLSGSYGVSSFIVFHTGDVDERSLFYKAPNFGLSRLVHCQSYSKSLWNKGLMRGDNNKIIIISRMGVDNLLYTPYHNRFSYLKNDGGIDKLIFEALERLKLEPKFSSTNTNYLFIKYVIDLNEVKRLDNRVILHHQDTETCFYRQLEGDPIILVNKDIYKDTVSLDRAAVSMTLIDINENNVKYYRTPSGTIVKLTSTVDNKRDPGVYYTDVIIDHDNNPVGHVIKHLTLEEAKKKGVIFDTFKEAQELSTPELRAKKEIQIMELKALKLKALNAYKNEIYRSEELMRTIHKSEAETFKNFLGFLASLLGVIKLFK